jgi:hypothetical protein
VLRASAKLTRTRKYKIICWSELLVESVACPSASHEQHSREVRLVNCPQRQTSDNFQLENQVVTIFG